MSLTPQKLLGGALPASALMPRVIRPIADAVVGGADPISTVLAVVQNLGFDSFVYGLSLSPRPDREAQLFVFTTLPKEWLVIYDQRAYVEVDPRIECALRSGAVEMWDQSTFRGKSPQVEEFLDAAATFGIRSGICFTLHDVSHHGAMVALNSGIPLIDRVRVQLIERNLSDIVSFGHYFHSWFINSVLSTNAPSKLRGAALSRREVEVLKLVARGLSTEDVAHRINVVPRTVQLHLDSARAKLGAANRQQAVALAIKSGFISVVE